MIANHHQHLQEDTDKYWQKHLKAQFPQEKFPERKFGWKKLYKKLLSERERKLNRTTESIISKMNQKQQQGETELSNGFFKFCITK